MMKLYIWHNVLRDWTAGNITVMAESEEQARELVYAKDGEDSDFFRKEIDFPPEVIEVAHAIFSWGYCRTLQELHSYSEH